MWLVTWHTISTQCHFLSITLPFLDTCKVSTRSGNQLNPLTSGVFSESFSLPWLHRPPAKPLILSMWPCMLCTLCFILWKGSLFGDMWLYSHFYIPVAGAPNGANCEAGDFHENLAFPFLDNTQRSITIYTRARVSLLSSCSLEHGPSIIAEKPAVKTQFVRCLYTLPGGNGLITFLWVCGSERNWRPTQDV